MRETWVGSLGWEDPLEKGKATHSSILAWRIGWNHEELGTIEQLALQDPLEKGKGTHSSILAWRLPRNRQESDMTEWLSLHFTSMPLHSINVTFIYAGKPKNSYNFTLLQYSLYCHGLELNLQHLPGVCAWTVFPNANFKSSNWFWHKHSLRNV